MLPGVFFSVFFTFRLLVLVNLDCLYHYCILQYQIASYFTLAGNNIIMDIKRSVESNRNNL